MSTNRVFYVYQKWTTLILTLCENANLCIFYKKSFEIIVLMEIDETWSRPVKFFTQPIDKKNFQKKHLHEL